jgi:hypothetical protein
MLDKHEKKVYNKLNDFSFKEHTMEQKINVAAYIWPSYTGKEPRSRIF